MKLLILLSLLLGGFAVLIKPFIAHVYSHNIDPHFAEKIPNMLLHPAG